MMKFSYALIGVLGVVFSIGSVAGARAQLLVNLDQSLITTTPGAVVDFTGNLVNSSTTDTVFLNGAAFPQVDAGLTADGSPFILNTPASLGPQQTLPMSVTLFTVTVDSNLQPGEYSGVFEVQGGPDNMTYNDLVETPFHIVIPAAVPEAGDITLLCSLLTAGGLAFRRRRLTRA
jgi:hypothetical protein